eukprot:2463343-Pyramimonas_sp.AAC.1
MSEHHALLHACGHVVLQEQDFHMFEDCAAVVHGAAVPTRARAGRRQQAGHWRQIQHPTEFG